MAKAELPPVLVGALSVPSCAAAERLLLAAPTASHPHALHLSFRQQSAATRRQSEPLAARQRTHGTAEAVASRRASLCRAYATPVQYDEARRRCCGRLRAAYQRLGR
eukprot:6193275-Pleurochrysis_carterae.AAC.5